MNILEAIVLLLGCLAAAAAMIGFERTKSLLKLAIGLLTMGAVMELLRLTT